MPPSVLLIQLLLSAIIIMAIPHNGTAYNIDFTAFYCGAKVALQHQDPYRAATLMACEIPIYGVHMHSARQALVVPVPFPGAYFALLSPLALIPYSIAAKLWSGLIVVAAGANIWLFRRLTGLPYLTLALALFFIGGYIPFILGQPTPFILTIFIGAAYALRQARYAVCATSLSLLWVEPHLALPIVLAVFVHQKKMRVPLIVGATIFAVITFAYLGFDTTREYIFNALPAQARAEIRFDNQVSLGAQFGLAGLPPEVAVKMSEGIFALSLVVATWLSGKLAIHWNDQAALVFTAPACTLFWGPYLHVEHLIFAFPLLGLLCVHSSSRKQLNQVLAVSVFLFYPSALLGSMYGLACRPPVHAVFLSSAVTASTLASDVWAAIVTFGENEGVSHFWECIWRIPTLVSLVLLPVLLYRFIRSDDTKNIENNNEVIPLAV